MSVNGVNGPRGIHAILQDVSVDNANSALPKKVDFAESEASKVLEQMTMSSPLKNTPLSDKAIQAKGFNMLAMDMNGGAIYQNDVTGDKLRIERNPLDGSSKYMYTFGNGNGHTVLYDENGRFDKGYVIYKDKGGDTKVIEYDQNHNGEKVITLVTTAS